MEKLLNLLQEFYGENRKFSNDDGLLTMTNGVENLSGAYAQTYIISLKGGFIHWLVENHKIDRDRCDCRQLYNALKKSEDMHGDKNFSRCERVIMLLAIQDKPLRFLCEILK